MRNLILALLVGLVIGTGGTLTYQHVLGDGKKLEATQIELESTKATLVTASTKSQTVEAQAKDLSSEITQLTSRNSELKKQVDSLKETAAAAVPPKPVVNPMVAMMRAHLEQQHQQRLQILKVRLHLTPEQEAAVKAAMDVESQKAEDMAAKMFQGGKIDPQSVADLQKNKTVDQTLNDLLTPEQKTDYDKMKSDEKTSQSETMATFELNRISPLLQLDEGQKDQVYNVIYQNSVNSQDPAWIKANLPSGPSDPVSVMEAQAKAKEDALAKVLTPQQLALYHQQAQSQLDMQKAMMQKFMPAANATAAKTP